MIRGTFSLLILFAFTACVQPGAEPEFEVVESEKVDVSTSNLDVFENTVYSLVRSKTCVNCHTAQSPQFASANVEEAYIALTRSKKVDLSSPSDSRIVRKIVDQQHNCWSGDCAADSQTMLEAVQEWAASASSEENSGSYAYVTGALPIPTTTDYAQTEYGKIVLQAEQDEHPEVVNGRFSTKIDSTAIGKKYIEATLASENPITSSPRITSITTGATCTPLEITDIIDSVNGQVQIAEGEVFLSSGDRKNATNDIVRDGFRPYKVKLRGQLIRPDKRLEFAHMMKSGDYSDIASVLANTGNGQTGYYGPGNSSRLETPLPLLLGSPSELLGISVLPHLVRYDEVFNGWATTTKRGPKDLYTKLDGTTDDLYNLFKGGSFDTNHDQIRRKLEQDPDGTPAFYRKKIFYYQLKKAVETNHSTTYMVNNSNSSNVIRNITYARSRNQHFLKEYSKIERTCKYAIGDKDKWVEPKCNLDEVKCQCDIDNPSNEASCISSRKAKGAMNCDSNYPLAHVDSTPDPLKKGKPYYPNTWWDYTHMTGPELTLGNMREKVTVDDNGTVGDLSDDTIRAATGGEIAAGNFFERIDMYIHYAVDLTTQELPNEQAGTASISDNKLPSVDQAATDAANGSAGYNVNTFYYPEIFNTTYTVGTNQFNYDIDNGNSFTNLDLLNILKGLDEEVSPEVELNTFKTTLFPKIQAASCTSCHNGSNSNIPPFAVSDPQQALGIIKSNSLVNFSNIADSFRGAAGGMVHNCGSNCNQYKSDFINAITSWDTQMKATISGDDFGKLEDDERIPGNAQYEFRVTEKGFYNIWLRIKSITGNTQSLAYKIEKLGTPVALTPVRNIVTTQSAGSQCTTIGTDAANWKWITKGRSTELGVLDIKGKRLLDNNKDVLPIPDTREYYDLVEGLYRLTLTEIEPGIAIDMVALDKVFESPAVFDGTTTAISLAPDDANKILEFQPDRREVDYKNISDYKRHVLKYDLTDKLALTGSDEAYFELEIREDFGDQNYVFRNPRFKITDATKSIYVNNLSVLINGKAAFTDKTFEKMDGYYGTNRVITYAPMVTLNQDRLAGDRFSIGFQDIGTDVIAKLSDTSPAGEPPKEPQERDCLELDQFIKTVKPILKRVTVSLVQGNNDLLDIMNAFPGNPEQGRTAVPAYKCMTCHNENHPYFKMTTFEGNDDQLCRQAISRVDFDNFYQSLIVRGINGTNGHPKFYFMEELMFAGAGESDKSQYRVHDEAQDYLDGYTVNNPTNKISSRVIDTSLFPIFNKTELGLGAATDYNVLSAEDKAKARMIGKIKSLSPIKLSTNPADYNSLYYDEEAHGALLGGTRIETDSPGALTEPSSNHYMNITDENGNITGQVVNPDIFPIIKNRRSSRSMYYDFDSADYINSLVYNAGGDIMEVNGNPAFNNFPQFGANTTNMPISFHIEKSGSGSESKHASPKRFFYDGTNKANLNTSKDHLFLESEKLRSKYREAIIRWIRAEYDAKQALP